MTVAQLKERMDARFNAVDRRLEALEAHFRRLFHSMDSLGQNVEANRRAMKTGFEHHEKVLSEHNRRITDLEPPRV